MNEPIIEALVLHRSALEAASSHEALEAHSAALVSSLTQLRRRDPERARVEAEATLTRVTALAREDGPRWLACLVAVTEQYARCCQRLRHFEQAVAAFGRAVEGAKLLAISGASSTLELASLLSAQALCLAQAGELDGAHASAERSVELARARMWEGLPLTVGGLSLMADLADDLGRPEQARAHLELALGLLADAASAGQPGIAEARAKLRARIDAQSSPAGE